MLTQEEKEHHMQVFQDLLNQYKAEADSFLDCIITGDKMWFHQYEPESKHQSIMEWRREFLTEENVQDTVLSR